MSCSAVVFSQLQLITEILQWPGAKGLPYLLVWFTRRWNTWSKALNYTHLSRLRGSTERTHTVICRLMLYYKQYEYVAGTFSIADPDPGSKIEFYRIPNRYFWELGDYFLSKSTVLLFLVNQFNFVILWLQKRLDNKFFPLLLCYCCWIWVPGWIKVRIRDQPSGSATLGVRHRVLTSKCTFSSHCTVY
jgi:hypothetical protein